MLTTIDTLDVLKTSVDNKSIYRRHFGKRDGRDLFLYGYEPHTLSPVKEDDYPVAKGGELRWHPLRGEWNLYAPHRQNRTFKPSTAEDPLAPSVNGRPPTEVPFTDFELAIFENKFTSLHAEAPVPSTPPGIRSMRAEGRCDVVIYGPEAIGNLYSIGQAKRRLLLAAWIDRYTTLYDAGHKYVLPFENRGDAVGVTLAHPHGQIYAFPFVPVTQQKAVDTFADGYDLARDIDQYKSEYGVAEAGGIEAYCPPYARFPYEIWLAPRRRRTGLWDFNETELDGFASLLGDITRRYDVHFQAPTAYMLSLHAAPLGQDKNFHFTAQFYPLLRAPGKVKYLASVEQSTGAFTVDVMPEMAAKTLRAL
jgi:UDPglucose--hexose-1-phosphate uridylyltransferase